MLITHAFACNLRDVETRSPDHEIIIKTIDKSGRYIDT